MHALTERQLRRSFVNASRGETAGLTLPKDFDAVDWAELDLLGWRDAKAPLRGYLVLEVDGEPVGIALRAAESRMSSRTAAMCLLCQTAQSGDAVSLFTAKRAGAAGRNGDTVGTYVCADLDCAHQVRAVPPSAQHLDDELQALAVQEQVEGLHRRLRAFTADVTRR